MDKKGDLFINGSGSSNGGTFSNVTINGKGTINNDIQCTEFDCNGSGTILGKVTAEYAKINGGVKITGDLEGKKVEVNGTAKVEHNVSVDRLKVDGKATIGVKVKAEEIRIKGRLTVEEDCEAEFFKAESQFKIGGLLNAEHIDIKLFGECRAKEIGGETISIKNKDAVFGLFKSFFPTQLETEFIEGNHIEIENTKAKVIRGNHCIIGPNCEIGLVEYTDQISIAKSANVMESKKV